MLIYLILCVSHWGSHSGVYVLCHVLGKFLRNTSMTHWYTFCLLIKPVGVLTTQINWRHLFCLLFSVQISFITCYFKIYITENSFSKIIIKLFKNNQRKQEKRFGNGGTLSFFILIIITVRIQRSMITTNKPADIHSKVYSESGFLHNIIVCCKQSFSLYFFYLRYLAQCIIVTII